MLKVKKLRIAAVACLMLLPCIAAAVNKCVDLQGRVQYQQEPCAPLNKEVKTGIVSQKSSPIPKDVGISEAGRRVRLLNAVVIQEYANQGRSIKFSLHPEWTNYGREVEVLGKVQLLNAQGKELNSYPVYKKLDSMGSSSAPQYLDLVQVDDPAEFDYKNVVKAKLTYSVKGLSGEVVLNQIDVKKLPKK